MAAPATPTSPCPHGDLARATPKQIAAISQATWDDWRTREHRREAAIKRLLRYLPQFPGETWQQRWEAILADGWGIRLSEKHALIAPSRSVYE